MPDTGAPLPAVVFDNGLDNRQPQPGQAVALRPRKTGQTVAYLRIFSGRLTRKLSVRAEHAHGGE
jgi:hypothetical protein